MPYDPNKHRRRSIRLKDYDYTQPGAYFVTMVVQDRSCLFGKICNGEIRLSQIGEIIRQVWRAIPSHFSNARLDEFVIMPNHFHGILWILDSSEDAGEAFGFSNFGRFINQEPSASPQQVRGTNPGSLNAILQNFKSISTRKINQHLNTPGNKLWQRDYYERIIRDERELNATRIYILTNPANWAEDRNSLYGQSIR